MCFDTGALVAAERRKQRVMRFLHLAKDGRGELIIPYPVLAEWWRSRTPDREDILAGARIASSPDIALAAGMALARMRRPRSDLTIDAMVIATAALARGIVLTKNPDDFEELRTHFPGVKVLAV